MCPVGALSFFVTNVFVSIDAEVLNEDVLGKAVFFSFVFIFKRGNDPQTY